MGVDLTVDYNKNSSTYSINDDQGNEFSLKIDYVYFDIAGIIKVHPKDGPIYLVIGGNVGLALTSTNLSYQSEDLLDEEERLGLQQNFRRAMKGNNNVSFTAAVGGYIALDTDDEKLFHLDARLNLGLIGVVETLSNSNLLFESENKTISFQLSIGYMFSIDE